jgi:hypothetical protein
MATIQFPRKMVRQPPATDHIIISQLLGKHEAQMLPTKGSCAVIEHGNTTKENLQGNIHFTPQHTVFILIDKENSALIIVRHQNLIKCIK